LRFEVKQIFLALAVALVLFPVSAIRAVAMTADDLRIDTQWKLVRLIIKGNKALAESELTKTMQTKARPPYLFWREFPDFDPDAFKSDIERLQRLYHSRGYYHSKVTYDLETKGALVDAIVTIKEGPQTSVSVVEVLVNGRPADPEVVAMVPLAKGSPFTEAAYQSGESAVRGYFLDRGHGRAKVERSAEVDTHLNLARIHYKAESGPLTFFGETTIVGSHDVEPYIVAREIAYKPGELFSPKKIADSRKKILGLSLFSAVDFTPDLDAKDQSVLPITVRVTEKPPHDIKLGGGYGTQDEFRVSAQWADHNFIGDAREITFMAQYSTIESAGEVKLLQRHFPSLDQDVLIDAKLNYETERPFDLAAVQVLPLLQEHFSSTLSGSAGFRTEWFKVTDVDPAAVREIGGVRSDGILLGPTAQVSWNTTENPLNPTQGAITTVNAEQAGSIWGGQANFYEFTGEVRKYTSIGWDTVFANRLKLGFADAIGPTSEGVPIFERFYSGGPGSVRGYGRWDIGPRSVDNVPLGGLSLLEGAFELRRPLFDGLAGALFVDFGDVSVRKFHPPVTDLKFGSGPALMYNTPVGPVRLDLGLPFQKPRRDQAWQIYFSIGQYF